MSLEKYAELTDDMEMKLDEADKATETRDIRYKHEEVFAKARARINAGQLRYLSKYEDDLNEIIH